MTEYMADYANSYALVMGVDGYANLPPLGTAAKGAGDFGALLESKYKFNVTLLTDNQLTRDSIFRWLNDTRRKVGADDRVVIYFAGHGMTRGDDKNERGYLCLSQTVIDEWQTAIPMDDITEEAEYFNCKHLLYVLDCCFSGMALGGRAVPDLPHELSYFLTRPVRYAITAGGKEVVDDSAAPGGKYSLFTYHMMQWLTDERLNPDDGIWRARDLGNYLEEQVARSRRSGHKPNHSYLPGSGDGDFVFQWARGTQIPREVAVPLMAANSIVRLGAVTALIQLVKDADADVAKLARASLEKIAAEDPDPAIHEVAQAFLEGREVRKDNAGISAEMRKKLEQAERSQQDQEAQLSAAHAERDRAVQLASEARQQLELAAKETGRVIYERPLGFAFALMASPLPLIVLGALISASYEPYRRGYAAIVSYFVLLVALPVLSAFAGHLYVNLTWAVSRSLQPSQARLGGGAAAAAGAFFMMLVTSFLYTSRDPDSTLTSAIVSATMLGITSGLVYGALCAFVGSFAASLRLYFIRNAQAEA